jgi:hypothetical protein
MLSVYDVFLTLVTSTYSVFWSLYSKADMVLAAFTWKLLMWFWPVNEMIELVSGMPAPQFGEESS